MDIDEQLIEEVRSRTILYDLGEADYKNLKKKELAWREIAAVVKMNEMECKKRWKGLRDSYKRCKRMEQFASGSAAEAPKKRWRYFEALTFLDNVTSSRHTIGNISCSLSEEDIIEMVDDSSEEFVPSASQCSTSLREKKKSDSEKFQEFVDFAASSISEKCGSSANAKKEEDCTALHFASLAAKIKATNMPPNIVNKIEAKVSVLVFSEIEAFYSNSEH